MIALGYVRGNGLGMALGVVVLVIAAARLLLP